MNVNAIFRVWSYLKFWFTAWNTGGEGVHSPSLFYLVRMIMYDDNRYYSWQAIEKQRKMLLASSECVCVDDYGTGHSGEKKVRDIASHSLETPKIAQMLYRIASYSLHCDGSEAMEKKILELGTCLGITTSYLAMVDSRVKVTGMEGAGELLRISREVWNRLGLKNIEWVQGDISDKLPEWVKGTLYNNARARLPFVFMDANHSYTATINYYKELVPLMGEGSIMVIDDIHHSREMERAWHEIQNREEVTSTIDVFRCGLVFFNTAYLKRHYKMRI